MLAPDQRTRDAASERRVLECVLCVVSCSERSGPGLCNVLVFRPPGSSTYAAGWAIARPTADPSCPVGGKVVPPRRCVWALATAGRARKEPCVRQYALATSSRVSYRYIQYISSCNTGALMPANSSRPSEAPALCPRDAASACCCCCSSPAKTRAQEKAARPRG